MSYLEQLVCLSVTHIWVPAYTKTPHTLHTKHTTHHTHTTHTPHSPHTHTHHTNDTQHTHTPHTHTHTQQQIKQNKINKKNGKSKNGRLKYKIQTMRQQAP